MDKRIKEGSVVQLGPDTKNLAFAYNFMIVDEVKSWGVQGYVQCLGTRNEIGGRAPYREEHENITYIGITAWYAKSV